MGSRDGLRDKSIKKLLHVSNLLLELLNGGRVCSRGIFRHRIVWSMHRVVWSLERVLGRCGMCHGGSNGKTVLLALPSGVCVGKES